MFLVRLVVSFILVVSVLANPVSLTLFAGYANQLAYKGAPTWPGPSLIIAPFFAFFDGHLRLTGPGLTWAFYDREDQHQFEIGFKYSDGAQKPMIRLNDTTESFRNKRRSVVDTNIKYTYRFGEKNRWGFGVDIEREIHRYNGVSSEFAFYAPLIPLVSFKYSINIAEKSSNQYAYGPEANGGVGYQSYTISNFIPFVPWNGRIINTLSYSVIGQGASRHADYVRGDYKNWIFITRWMWSIF
ncbi:hypothetical protein [Bacteriovorax sp. Seq25_V]|uniref:hypothetical protein n=1 Tax=Bacteriovorax sp. Seq25_V TaxID=1201288 RepID=UPI00038A26BE|nr:hypothetical protein [Bacteriovorax sp. Seq25_V]EQC45353.1 hypothetical protein M900_2235 [Bacteriovorax sp. Seq25_V]